ncbi:hypothetical protein cypCar_00014829, partial [Cyprinus carpio]
PPAVEPVYTEIRQGLGRPFSLSCRVLRAHPSKVLDYEWKLGTRLLTVGQLHTRDETEYHDTLKAIILHKPCIYDEPLLAVMQEHAARA